MQIRTTQGNVHYRRHFKNVWRAQIRKPGLLTFSHRVFTWPSDSCLHSLSCSIHWSISFVNALSSMSVFVLLFSSRGGGGGEKERERGLRGRCGRAPLTAAQGAELVRGRLARSSGKGRRRCEANAALLRLA